MIDIKLIRENPEIVKENMKRKFQDQKLPLVDEVIDLDKKNRAAITEVEALRAKRTNLSKQIGALMGQGKRDEAEAIKTESQQIGQKIVELEVEQENVCSFSSPHCSQLPLAKREAVNVENQLLKQIRSALVDFLQTGLANLAMV